MNPIEELQLAIQGMHNVVATHKESVPVKEVFQGKTVWDGIVEVFHIKGHPKTDIAYAWFHKPEDPDQPWKTITVLHINPALTPLAAVQAFIVQEFRANADAEA
jgi:hypothetical protein